MSDTATLISTLTDLCIKYSINVCVNPVQYQINSPAAIDVEHDEAGNLVGIGVYDGAHSFYFTLVTDSLRTLLPRMSFIAHNGKGDFESLRQWGIPLLESQLIWDTFLLGHILDSSKGNYGLKAMAERELGIVYPSYDEIVGKHKGKTKAGPKCPGLRSDCCGRITLDKQPIELVSRYNALDCYVPYKLYELQRK